MDGFMTRSRQGFDGRRPQGDCVYSQEQLLGTDAQGQLVATIPNLGAAMLGDITRHRCRLLTEIARAGRFGPPARCQLFVGASAAANARTVLHFDQYDNVFMQLSGRKTFCSLILCNLAGCIPIRSIIRSTALLR